MKEALSSVPTDHLLLIFMGISAIAFAGLGFMKGMTVQVFSLMGLALAFLVSPYVGGYLVDIAQRHTQVELLQASFIQPMAILMIGTALYTWMLGIGTKIHKNHVDRGILRRGLDRILGGVLGAVKGIAIVLVVWVFIGKSTGAGKNAEPTAALPQSPAELHDALPEK